MIVAVQSSLVPSVTQCCRPVHTVDVLPSLWSCFQGSYAMGYNLAIEYLADPEKTWMLESFRQLDSRVLQPQHRALKEWLFLTVSPFPPPPDPSPLLL